MVVEPGSLLTLPRDAGKASEAIRTYSPNDAGKWPAFTTLLSKLAGFLEVLYQTPAPDVSASSPGDLLPMLGLLRKFRALGRRDMIEFLRTLPLSVWELLDDWFDHAPLKAAVAAGGVQDHRQGPRSGGTGFVLLHHLVGAPAGSVRGRPPWRAGPAAFTEAGCVAPGLVFPRFDGPEEGSGGPPPDEQFDGLHDERQIVQLKFFGVVCHANTFIAINCDHSTLACPSLVGAC